MKSQKSNAQMTDCRKYYHHRQRKPCWIPPPGKTAAACKLSKLRNTINDQSSFLFMEKEVKKLEFLVETLENIFGKTSLRKMSEKESLLLKSISYENSLRNNVLNKDVSLNTGENNSNNSRKSLMATCFSIPSNKLEENNEKRPTSIVKCKYQKYKKYTKKLITSFKSIKTELENLKETDLEKDAKLLKMSQDEDYWKSELTRCQNEKLELRAQVEHLKHCLKECTEKDEIVRNDLKHEEINQQLCNDFMTLMEGNKKLELAKRVLEDRFLEAEKTVLKLKEKIEKMKKYRNEKNQIILKEKDVVKIKERNVEIIELETTIQKLKEENEDFRKDFKELQKKFEESQNSVLNLTLSLTKMEKSLRSQHEDHHLSTVFETNQQHSHFQELKLELQKQRDQLLENTKKLELALEEKTKYCFNQEKERNSIEQKYEIKLQELERKLQTFFSTNQSLQSYVTYLKKSYNSVFSDGTFSSVAHINIQG